MSLDGLLKFGYILIVVTITLMIWASLAGASMREFEQMVFPPCTYNPLCTCSKAAQDLGIVHCKDVPFPALPKMVNNSKVFMLHMENTGLREIQPYYLQATGMYRLKISNNHLTEIPDDAFFGLERVLWELILPYNDLIDIPSKSFRHLQKLKYLDLSYNHIKYINHDSFRGLEDSLQTLMLKENSISMLQSHGFSGLLVLETLDLSGNNLYEIDPSVFMDGMPRLSKLLLTDNMLSEIPFDALSPLKMLRTLDISHNVIYSMTPNDTKSSAKLSLDNLHLEYNNIEKLPPNSFVNFDVLNRTFFDGNPIKILMEDAFKPAKIREIYMRYCGLTHVSPVAFDSLTNSLQILDLSGNNLTNLPEKLFNSFDYLRVLSLRDNRIKIVAPVEMFNVFQYTLLKLDLSGGENAPTNLQELRNMTRMRNMRSLSISKMKTQSLGPEEFLEFGVELEDLQVTRGGLQTIKSHAFKYVRGLKRLDLSENGIGTIENDAFTEIGHSLISFKISHGYSGSSLPSDALRHLTSLQELDFSNNKISSMSDTSFHFLKNLRLLELHDNRIDQVMKGTFQGDIHSKLEEISFKFNKLKEISQHTFFDLEALEKLYLDDNQIDKIEKRAFMNLDRLEHLSLRGNKLTSLSEESFQIYKSDPLPKNICRRCITNVSLIYEETQKVLRIQNGWIDNVRANQPNHSYVNILDIIERSNHDMVNNIRTFIADFSVYEPRSTYNFLEGENSNNDYSNYIHPNSSDHHHTNMICDTKENEDIKDVKLFDNITITESSLLDSNITDTNISNTLDQNFTVISNQNIENNLQEIQYKLQSNGCSLVTINNSSTSNFQISQSTSSSSLSASSSSKCRLCKKLFPNQKLLAKHQIQHLIITDRKLYITKYLQKKLRRGKIGPKKYIRCLNCWKLFADNFSIVNHWSKSQCDFYCTICGLEFPYNPQLLREHVFKEHGINYKFSKPPEIHIENVIPKFVVRDMFNKTTTPFIPQTITNSSKPKRKQSTTTNGGRVSCAICFCSFPNFQSKNAHMRKHKNYSIKNKTTTTQSSINQNHHYQTVDKQNVKIENINVENHLEILMEIKSETNTEKNSVKPKLQVKKLSDLQNPPPASSSTSSLSSSSRVTQNDDYQHYNYFDHMRHRRSFVCHPCGRMFTTNAALYEHSKYCQMSYKYSCHFCFKDFYTSPDLQMHVVLMHRNN